MQVEQIIKDSCTWLTPAPEFFLASMDWFNVEGEKQVYWPVCLMDNVTTGQPLVTAQGVTKTTYDISLFFLHMYPKNEGEDLDKNPQIGNARHTAVDLMRVLAANLLQVVVKDSRLYKPSEDIAGALVRSVYNFMDMNLDGVQLTFKLTLHTAPVCFAKHSGAKP